MLSARLFLAACALLLAACSSPKICTRPVSRTDPAARALLTAAQQAHGREAFARVRDISVRYEGRWASIGPRFQPVLADTRFRRVSEERLLLRDRTLAQRHTGPGGEKTVLRRPGRIDVAYDGIEATDPEVQRAAALVADAYTLFLLGPHYFSRPGVTLVADAPATIDGAACDQVLAVLRPGFGEAAEDRVLLSIERESRLLRRVRMTLNGLQSTRGAEVDVTFRAFREVRGVLWPTDFDERIRVPFDLHAHHWRLTGLDLDRGLRPSDFTPRRWSGNAARSTPALVPSQGAN